MATVVDAHRSKRRRLVLWPAGKVGRLCETLKALEAAPPERRAHAPDTETPIEQMRQQAAKDSRAALAMVRDLR